MSAKRLMKRATYREPTQDMDRVAEMDSKKATRKDFVKVIRRGGETAFRRDGKMNGCVWLNAKSYSAADRISQIAIIGALK